MSDRVFYVGSLNKGQFTGYVPAKFLRIDGQPVVDPTPGGSQKSYVYADRSYKYKTTGRIGNPNNFLIVPANYTEQQARTFAAKVAETLKTERASAARELMSDAFTQ